MLNVYTLNTSFEVLAWVERQDPPSSQLTTTDGPDEAPCNVDCQPTIKVAGNRTGIALQLAEGQVQS
jgi:hypothetical protein